MKKNKKIKKIRKSLFKFFRPLADIKILIFAIAIVMIWRGIWNLVDTYFFPEHLLFSNITSIIIGIAILFFSDSKLYTLVDPGDDDKK